jgi:hypothetical protein
VKSLRWLYPCAFALSLSSLASADDVVNWARHRVDQALLQPLAKLERGSRFSRERPPPHERRLRVLATTLSHDKSGRAFVPFAIDIRFSGQDWQKDDIVGCAYRESGNLFVKTGDSYRPASFMLGKPADPVAGVCEAAPEASS